MSLPNIPNKSKSKVQHKKNISSGLDAVLDHQKSKTPVGSKSKQHEQAKREEYKTDDELVCAICSEMFIKATTLNCSHTFCKYCIDRWKKNQRDCPICRTRVTEQVPTLVLDNIIDKIIEKSSKEIQQRRKQMVEERLEQCNNNNTSCSKSEGKENYTWNTLIEALNCAEESNWQDDEDFINGDWLNRDSDNSSDDEYDIYTEYDMYY